MKSEYFIGLSLPIDQDGDPGDGGQAKDGFFDKGDNENERGIVSYKPREGLKQHFQQEESCIPSENTRPFPIGIQKDSK